MDSKKRQKSATKSEAKTQESEAQSQRRHAAEQAAESIKKRATVKTHGIDNVSQINDKILKRGIEIVRM